MSEAKELAEWQERRKKVKARFERLYPMAKRTDYECLRTRHFAKRYKTLIHE